MIYPTYGVTGIEDVPMLVHIIAALNQLKFYNAPDRYYNQLWINGLTHSYVYGPIPEEVTILSCEEFIKVYKEFGDNFYEWLYSLVPGDKVIIDKRVGFADDYPLGFNSAMAEYCGKEMTITHISKVYVDLRSRFDNGTVLGFDLKEDNGRFQWHSSMFVYNPLPPVVKLPIGDLNVESLFHSELLL